MSTGIPAIERPNGQLYRPRKIDAVALGNEDGITHVLIFGTHDARFAEVFAGPELERIQGEFYSTDYRLEISGAGRRGWWRRDLAGWVDGGPLYVFAEDPVKGRAGVRFSVEEVEAAA